MYDSYVDCSYRMRLTYIQLCIIMPQDMHFIMENIEKLIEVTIMILKNAIFDSFLIYRQFLVFE